MIVLGDHGPRRSQDEGRRSGMVHTTWWSRGEGNAVALAGPRRFASDTRLERAEFRCSGCSYGLIALVPPTACPMCGLNIWEQALKTTRAAEAAN